MKIEIKSRFSLQILFSHECEDNSVAITLAAAINAKADLYGADLYGADLYGANLYGANLRSANLYGANLYGANLGDADLGDAGKLTGDRPFFQVGPIGSRQDVLAAFQTEKGVFLRAGCFFGTVEEFNAKLQDEHGDNTHAVEYRAALVLIEAHYSAWPVTVTEGE
jgi:hypothetical protein